MLLDPYQALDPRKGDAKVKVPSLDSHLLQEQNSERNTIAKRARFARNMVAQSAARFIAMAERSSYLPRALVFRWDTRLLL